MLPFKPVSVVTPIVEYIAPFYPEPLRAELLAGTQELAFDVFRLGVEVMNAEHRGVAFSDAVKLSEYPLMERTYFGAQVFLQHRLPKLMRDVLIEMLRRGLEDDALRAERLIFEVARREHEPDAAACRFLLWVAVRIGLLVATWDEPELNETLDAMEARAERVVRELLLVPDLREPDVRPLQVLVAEMLVHSSRDATERFAAAVDYYGDELAELMSNAAALGEVRQLDDRHAVLFNPGHFAGQPGSTQIVRRYPMQHRSVTALEKTRSRLLERRRRGTKEVHTDRLIDVVRAFERGVR